MDFKMVLTLGFLLLAGLAMVNAEEFSEYPEMDSANQDEEKSAEEDEAAEDINSELTDVEQSDVSGVVKIPTKGFCQWQVDKWYKPGVSLRCSCMKCSCLAGGKWNCGYHFNYCPYFFCGGQIYNPKSQLCCCGKVYTKKHSFKCCGYNYFDTRRSKCCSFFSVKHKAANCPRYRI